MPSRKLPFFVPDVARGLFGADYAASVIATDAAIVYIAIAKCRFSKNKLCATGTYVPA